MTATYSKVEDLLTGDVPFSAALDPTRFIQDATDEVDSYIGLRYKTPLDMTAESPMVRPARLLVKRISNFLASGRLILAQSIGTEDRNTQAYGQSLVTEATKTLDQLAKGVIPLLGAVPAANPGGAIEGNMAAVFNSDSYSGVDAFYDFAMPIDPWGALVDSALPRWGPRWAPNR